MQLLVGVQFAVDALYVHTYVPQVCILADCMGAVAVHDILVVQSEQHHGAPTPSCDDSASSKQHSTPPAAQHTVARGGEGRGRDSSRQALALSRESVEVLLLNIWGFAFN